MDEVFPSIIGFVVGFILCLFLSSFREDSIIEEYQSSAIEHNCAAYDSQTGEWDWIDKE